MTCMTIAFDFVFLLVKILTMFHYLNGEQCALAARTIIATTTTTTIRNLVALWVATQWKNLLSTSVDLSACLCCLFFNSLVLLFILSSAAWSGFSVKFDLYGTWTLGIQFETLQWVHCVSCNVRIFKVYKGNWTSLVFWDNSHIFK